MKFCFNLHIPVSSDSTNRIIINDPINACYQTASFCSGPNELKGRVPSAILNNKRIKSINQCQREKEKTKCSTDSQQEQT